MKWDALYLLKVKESYIMNRGLQGAIRQESLQGIIGTGDTKQVTAAIKLATVHVQCHIKNISEKHLSKIEKGTLFNS